MTDRALRIAYHLAETVLEVSGTRTTQVSLETGERETVGDVTTEISTETHADPHDWLRVEPPENWLSDSKLTIELSDDGRLVSVGSSSTGQASQAVKGIISLVTTAVGAVSGVSVRPKRDVSADVKTQDREVDPGQPSHVYPQAECIAAIERRLTALQNRQLELYDELAEADDAQSRYSASSAARLIARAVEDLRGELALVLARKRAWTEAVRRREVESYVHRLHVHDLVADEATEDWPDGVLPDEIVDMGMVRDLDVLVTRRDERVHGRDSETPDWDGTSENGVWFRHPRRVELIIYRVGPKGEAGVPRKILNEADRRVIQVVDDACRHEFIPFDERVWGNSSAEANFNALGGLSTLTSEGTSGAGVAATAFGELPETVKSALTAASGILEAAAKIEDHSINREMARLENEKKLLQAEIAAATSASTEYEQRRIAELDARKDLLVARKEIGDKAIVH